VNVGAVGLGFMGSRWARCLAEHPGARLRVVSDVRQDLGREVASRFDAEYVPDALDAASHPALHGVVICTPEHLHVEVGLAAIDAGKAVAIEKPLAHTVADAEKIRDRSVERGVPVLVGHILRFEPRYAAMARAVHAGEIGNVQAIRSARIGLVSDQVILRGRTSIALYYGVHEFDLARWVAGEVERLGAERSRGVLEARGYPVEDLYSVVLRFASGAHGTATLGWSLPEGTPGWGIADFTVVGEAGVISVRQGELGFMKIGENAVADEDVFLSPDVHGRLDGALAAEVDHFVRCAEGRAAPLCTAGDGVEAVRISLAMEESAVSGASIELR
jgi:predicted dehydrogenase